MLQLVADIGNTETAVGLVESKGHRVQRHWRLRTRPPRTKAELEVFLGSLLGQRGDRAPIPQAVISSVAPEAVPGYSAAFSALVQGPVQLVGPSSQLPVRLDVEEPRTVGADRIVNTLAASTLYQMDAIVVDMGTAVTFDCVTRDAVFLGGVIAPGPSAGLDWLAERTAQLPRVGLEPPARVLGRRTKACIQSGVFFSAVDSVDGMVRRILEEWAPEECVVVATGGLSRLIGPHARTVERIDPLLTLKGLSIAGAHLAQL